MCHTCTFMCPFDIVVGSIVLTKKLYVLSVWKITVNCKFFFSFFSFFFFLPKSSKFQL
jgi:heterodisulfide reductase subunit C